jgi:hypothetical protein
LANKLKYTHPSDSKWEEIIESSENCYFFHTPVWAKVMEETYDYETATRLYEIDGNKILLPMMRSKGRGFYTYSSIPMGYGGIFSTSTLTPGVIQKILRGIVGGRSLRFTMSLPPFFNSPIQEDACITRIDTQWNYTHVLPLEQGFEYIWKKKFVGETRNAVRKAEKNNIKVITKNTFENYEIYYKLCIESSKRWGHKKPPYPLKFFENLYKFGSNHVRLRLALKDDIVIAALLNFYYADNVFYWGSAFVEEYKTYSSVNLLLKDAIEDACKKGYKYFNFGASGNLEGVRKFKESFGPEKVEVRQYLVQSRLVKLGMLALRR